MILWVSYGSGGGMAYALHRTHPTILYYDWGFAREKHLYDGLVPQVQSLEKGLHDRPDAVLFEQTGQGDLADRLRKWIPIWGAGEIQDELEQNRGWTLSLAHQVGISIPRTVIFNPQESPWNTGDKTIQVIRGWVNEAKQFISKEKGLRWVLKPYESDSSSTTYVSDGPDDLIERLSDLQEAQQIPRGSPFLLQEFIEGIELSTEVWIQNGRIIPGSGNNTIELKKFMPGDLGPTIGSSTSTVWFLKDPKSPIIEQLFLKKKLQEWFLRPVDSKNRPHPPYHGPLDFNTIIGKNGKIYFLEATPRLGWMTTYAMIQLLPSKELGSIFIKCSQGRLSHLPTITGTYAYELTMSHPPYPITEEIPMANRMGHVYREILEHATGIKIGGPINDPSLSWIDVRLNPRSRVLETAGTFGQIASITGSGKSLEDTRDYVHGLFKQIHLPEKQGRIIDGADRALEYIPQIRKAGFETP